MSVCLPVYNGAQYLGQAIESILAQSLGDFELILVDDCSSDASLSVARSFRDGRLRIECNPTRLGLVGNWNRCVELASGEYICIFHQDDRMEAQNLERKVQALDAAPGAGLVFSDASLIGPRGRTFSAHWYALPEPYADQVIPGGRFLDAYLEGENIICCPGVMLRRQCFAAQGLFDAQFPFSADYEMWCRVALAYDIAYLASPLVAYRMHAENETVHFRGARGLEQFMDARLHILKRYGDQIPDSAEKILRVGREFEERVAAELLAPGGRPPEETSRLLDLGKRCLEVQGRESEAEAWAGRMLEQSLAARRIPPPVSGQPPAHPILRRIQDFLLRLPLAGALLRRLRRSRPSDVQ